MSSSSFLKQAISKEKERRGQGVDTKINALLRTLSPIQRDFIQDPHRFKVAVAGRRGGKSHLDAAYMIIEAIKVPNTPILYLGLTRDSAKEAIWGILEAMLQGLHISYDPKPSALRINFPNGSSITLFGGDTPNAKNRLRGRKFKLIVADETGFFDGLDGLVKALLPTLADLQGTLIMTSSPGVTLNGFFYDAYQGVNKAEWKQWHWNMRDNPFFQKPASDPKYATLADEEFATMIRLQYGGNWSHPSFVREYLGEYQRDASALVYPYSDYNLVDGPTTLPREEYAIGIDLGVNSESAIVVLKYSLYSREVQIVHSWSEANVMIDPLAARIQSLIDRYKPTMIVADTGGLGAAFVQEFRRRYHLPIRSADKMEKAAYQRIFANDLLSGYIKVIRDLQIVQEWSKIVKDENGDEVKGQKNHEADAALYVYRYIYQTYLKTFKPAESDEDIMIRQLQESGLQEREELDELERDREYEF